MARPIRSGGLYAGLVSALLAGGSGVAQTPPDTMLSYPPVRLTVRPHAIVASRRDPAGPSAGEHLLDSLNQGFASDSYVGGFREAYITYDAEHVFRSEVYVPQKCTASGVRYPLVVFLFPDWTHPLLIEWQREMADKHGMILLALNDQKPFAQRAPGLAGNYMQYVDIMRYLDVTRIDAALTQVLRDYPIDPDKIAVISGGTGDALYVGRNNPTVFSRIAAREYQSGWTKTLVPPSERSVKALFYLLEDPLEFATEPGSSVLLTQGLRRDGYTVIHGLTRRNHEHRLEDWDVMYQWFGDSWASPAAAVPAPEPVPVLTAAALTAMTAFWPRFAEESDEVRLAHRKDITVLVGAEWMPTRVTDLAATAAEFPSVAAALKEAGLTAQQAEDSWRALIGAMTVLIATGPGGGNKVLPVEAGSALAQNIALLTAHPQEFESLQTIMAVQ